ncbi:hypothetical protein X973_04570 [Piscirickettsia salmonis]|nr:hypothetical protein X973_04570 [Piscirickettsia salmonis]WGZ72495.1 hypothetical protein E3220_13505 [Piscirickettsia salmonis EM-90]
MLEFLSHNCKEKASFFLIVFFNLLILCQKLLIQRYNGYLLMRLNPTLHHCYSNQSVYLNNHHIFARAK